MQSAQLVQGAFALALGRKEKSAQFRAAKIAMENQRPSEADQYWPVVQAHNRGVKPT